MQTISWKHIAKGVWINTGGRARSSVKTSISTGHLLGARDKVRVSIDSNATVANIGDMGSNRHGMTMGLGVHHHHHFVEAAFR